MCIKHNSLITAKIDQDFLNLVKIKKIKTKKTLSWKYKLKRFIVAKYFKSRITKKRLNGFWITKKQHCKGYYSLVKLHKKITFKIPQVKYKKIQKSSLKQDSKIKKITFLPKRNFFNLTLNEPAIFEPRLVEILRRTVSKIIKKAKKRYKTDAKWRCNINPNQPSTRKGRGTRMGTGKGGIRTWVYKAPLGKFFFGLKKTRVIQQPYTLVNKIKNILPHKTAIITAREILLWKKAFSLQQYI